MISITSALWKIYMSGLTAKNMYARQDDLKRLLTINEYLNCHMNTFAKNIAISQIRYSGIISTEDTTLRLGNINRLAQLVSSRVQHSLCSSILRYDLVEEYSDQLNINTNTTHQIVDWRSINKERKLD